MSWYEKSKRHSVHLLSNSLVKGLTKQPETGMGYQTCFVRLNNGKEYSRVHVANCSVITDINGLLKIPFSISEINMIAVASKDTAVLPENWDVVKECSGRQCCPKWKLWSGANDWETGVTLMAVVFGRDGGPGEKRLWVEVDNSQFSTANNNDQPKEVLEEVQTWGKKAVDTWVKVTERIFKTIEKDDWEASICDAFKDALKDDEMKPFVSKWGIDVLEWISDK